MPRRPPTRLAAACVWLPTPAGDGLECRLSIHSSHPDMKHPCVSLLFFVIFSLNLYGGELTDERRGPLAACPTPAPRAGKPLAVPSSPNCSNLITKAYAQIAITSHWRASSFRRHAQPPLLAAFCFWNFWLADSAFEKLSSVYMVPWRLRLSRTCPLTFFKIALYS